jgi:hypothetical protein
MSLTIQGLVVLFLGKALEWAGVQYDVESLRGWVSTTVVLIGAVGIWYGRYRNGDIRWWGGKK